MPTATIHVRVVKKYAFQLILFHACSGFSHNLVKFANFNMNKENVIYFWSVHQEIKE